MPSQQKFWRLEVIDQDVSRLVSSKKSFSLVSGWLLSFRSSLSLPSIHVCFLISSSKDTIHIELDLLIWSHFTLIIFKKFWVTDNWDVKIWILGGGGWLQFMKPFTTYCYLPAKCNNVHQKMPTKIEITQIELYFCSRNRRMDNSIGTYFFFYVRVFYMWLRMNGSWIAYMAGTLHMFQNTNNTIEILGHLLRSYYIS